MLAENSRPTKLFLVVLSVTSIVTVLWLATLAFLDAGISGAMAQTIAASGQFPWTRAALVDFSLMTAFVSVWIWARESNPLFGAAYIVLLWVFGAAFLGVYVLSSLVKSEPQQAKQ